MACLSVHLARCVAGALISLTGVMVFAGYSRPPEINRYNANPWMDTPGSTAAEHAVPTPVEATNNMLFRHVNGLDPEERPFDPADIDCGPGRKCELGDPFGRLLVKTNNHLPRTVNEVLALLDTLGPETGALVEQDIYLVSETGQIPLSEAPELTRDHERAVIVRQNKSDVVLISPSVRNDGNEATLEVMGWDKCKKLFNYYARKSVPPRWVWKGDSSHAWNAKTKDEACFSCHRNGEPVMKELNDPWQNWHSQAATIKPESIPADSPLKTNPLFSILDDKFLKLAETLEQVVKQWVVELNRSRIARYKAGELSVRNILEPLFKSSTVNLQPSTDVSAAGAPIRIPWTFFYNVDALDAGGLVCDAVGAFGQSPPSLDNNSYRAALDALKFRLESPVGPPESPKEYFKQPADTYFAFLTPEPAKTDVDLILNLIQQRVISRRLAVTLTLVDVPNPVYSRTRKELFDLIPNWTITDVGPTGIDDRLVTLFRDRQNAGVQNELARKALAQFFALWASPPNTWEADACARLEYYLKNVGAHWRDRKYLPYFKLLGARREMFFQSDHGGLNESALLFPRSETDPNLTMQFDGTVK